LNGDSLFTDRPAFAAPDECGLPGVVCGTQFGSFNTIPQRIDVRRVFFYPPKWRSAGEERKITVRVETYSPAGNRRDTLPKCVPKKSA
jgi:hypothetical protein